MGIPTAILGQDRPLRVAAEISSMRPFAPARRVAVALKARRRHQGGDPIDQLHGGEKQRAVPARTGLGELIAQAFGIELAQPAQGERRPGAIAQQPLAPGAVGSRCAPSHRRRSRRRVPIAPSPARHRAVAGPGARTRATAAGVRRPAQRDGGGIKAGVRSSSRATPTMWWRDLSPKGRPGAF